MFVNPSKRGCAIFLTSFRFKINLNKSKIAVYVNSEGMKTRYTRLVLARPNTAGEKGPQKCLATILFKNQITFWDS